QALAAQCYRRNLRELVRPEIVGGISLPEIDYVAERLAETSMFSRVEKLGNPWTLENESALARISPRKANRTELQKCEDVANNVLLLEGVVGRAGAMRGTYEAMMAKKKRLAIAATLYRKASSGTFHSQNESEVLRLMSVHVVDWVRI